jgi:AcrR family transcriptional regulator
MYTKGDQTKMKIVEAAMMLFAEKGYTAVTMKDVCERCQMSRGGVYRYFASTKEIFITMLDMDFEKNFEIVTKCIDENIAADRILHSYFEQEIESIRSDGKGLYFAIHEFAFAEPDQRHKMNLRVKDGINVLKMIFEHGHAQGVFKPFDIEAVSVHMIYFMDSLKTSAAILDISDEMLAKQMALLSAMVLDCPKDSIEKGGVTYDEKRTERKL